MNNKPSSKNKSLYPNEMLDTEDDSNGWQISYLDIITIILGFLVILLSASEFTSATSLTSISNLFKSSVQETEFITTPIEEVQDELENALESDIDGGKIEIIRDLNDVVIRFSSDELYRSGSATLQQEALPQFDRIINAIKSNRYTDFNVEVEGHTDNTPISSVAYPSNWELSTTRATNVVKYFRGMGINEKRLKASGYADSRPLVPNEDISGNPLPKNKALNRRVDIRLYYTGISTRDSSNTNSPIIELNDATCKYSIQVGGFQSFNNSFSFANQASKETGYVYDITFNNNLFSVRTKTLNALDEALEIHQKLSESLGDNPLGLIHQCYQNSETEPIPVSYQIQIAAFQNRNNAENYITDLRTSRALPVSISSGNNGPYKVMAGPYLNPVTVSEKLEELKNSGMPDGIFIKPTLENIQPYSFNFKIQLARFDSQEDAEDLSQNVSTSLDLETEISASENGAFYLVTNEYQDWNTVQQIFSELRNTSYNLSPVIYLLERIEIAS